MVAPVWADEDFRRVRDLPVRIWDEETTADLTARLTAHLKTPAGTQHLFPTQGRALADIWHGKGALTGAGVGHGKTLISVLAGTLLGAERPLLLVPASCVAKTHSELVGIRQHWRVPDNLVVLSYTALQGKNENILFDLDPDLIVADECHALKARNTKRSRRFLRYMKVKKTCTFVGLSGTVTRKSLQDHAHLQVLALGQGAPVPKKWPTLQMWSMAMDAGVPEFMRPAPGILLDLAPDIEGDGGLDHARACYQARMARTPGITLTAESAIGIPLRLIPTNIDVPVAVNDAICNLVQTWCTPDGDELVNAAEVWAAARQLACGFWYQWAGVPPAEWMTARQNWNRFVRATLASSRSIDSPLEVANAHPDHPITLEWQRLKNTYKIQTVPQWLSRFVVEAAAAWLAEHKQIVWVEHRAVGPAIAEAAGVPFFGADDNRILTHTGPCVASIRAHGTGKNLQHYNRALVVTPPSAGADWEQLLGRLHRPGQRADEVQFDVFAHTDANQNAITSALDSARYLEKITGSPQKLLAAWRPTGV